MRARYETVCMYCGHRINEGDEIVESEMDGWVHADYRHIRAEERRVPCPACWLVHPEGECDRD